MIIQRSRHYCHYFIQLKYWTFQMYQHIKTKWSVRAISQNIWLKQNSILSIFAEKLSLTLRQMGSWCKDLNVHVTLGVGRIDMWLIPWLKASSNLKVFYAIPENFRKSHRKTSAMEFFFDELADCKFTNGRLHHRFLLVDFTKFF